MTDTTEQPGLSQDIALGAAVLAYAVVNALIYVALFGAPDPSRLNSLIVALCFFTFLGPILVILGMVGSQLLGRFCQSRPPFYWPVVVGLAVIVLMVACANFYILCVVMAAV
jgi:hypothetical protein